MTRKTMPSTWPITPGRTLQVTRSEGPRWGPGGTSAGWERSRRRCPRRRRRARRERRCRRCKAHRRVLRFTECGPCLKTTSTNQHDHKCLVVVSAVAATSDRGRVAVFQMPRSNDGSRQPSQPERREFLLFACNRRPLTTETWGTLRLAGKCGAVLLGQADCPKRLTSRLSKNTGVDG